MERVLDSHGRRVRLKIYCVIVIDCDYCLSVSIFPRIKRPGRESDTLLPFSADVMHVWNYTSIPSVFTAWYLIKYKQRLISLSLKHLSGSNRLIWAFCFQTLETNLICESRLSRSWLWRIQHSGFYRRVVLRQPGVSEEHIVSIIRAEV
jgi:hypothetical protein